MATAAISSISSAKARNERHSAKAAATLLAVAGSMIALVGVFLALVGALLDTDASIFFTLVGFGLVISGALLAKRHIAGAWTYMAVYVGTTFWSVHELHPGGSSLGYRFIGPITLLVMISLLMPVLGRWSRRKTVTVCVILTTATLAIGTMSADPDQGANGPPQVTASSPNPATDGVMQ